MTLRQSILERTQTGKLAVLVFAAARKVYISSYGWYQNGIGTKAKHTFNHSFVPRETPIKQAEMVLSHAFFS